MTIFGDARINGWENWSWATINEANTSPVRTGSRSIAVTAGGWQAVSLRRKPFDSTIYRALRFAVHGGPTGGQQLFVKSHIGDVIQQGQINIGPLAANQWQVIEIPLSSLGAANRRNFTGFWIQNGTGSSIPTFYLDDIELLPIQLTGNPSVSVPVNQPAGTVPRLPFGVNVAIWDSQLNSGPTHQNLRNLGTSMLRYPGGSLSNNYNWKTNLDPTGSWQWWSNFGVFANVLQQTGQEGVITTNYGSGTPQLAADWVLDANVIRGLGIEYWEVGNECYGTWEVDNQARKHDGLTYANRFVEYYNQMKAIDPTIKIGMPITASQDDWANHADRIVTNPRTGTQHSGWSAVAIHRLAQLGVRPEFVAFHKYPYYIGDENDDILLQLAQELRDDYPAIRQMLVDYFGPAGNSIEIHLNEINANAGAQGKQSTSLVNGLFLADAYGQSLRAGFETMVWWDWINGKDFTGNMASHLYGWRNYGDLAMGENNNNLYPTYYTGKILQHFAQPGDTVLPLASSHPFVGSYGVRKPDGAVHVMLINKRPTGIINSVVNFTDFVPAGSYSLVRYGIPQDEAARLNSGNRDLTFSTATGGAASTPIQLPPYSVSVLQLRSHRQVTGNLILGDLSTPWPTSRTLTFQFRPVGGTSFTYSVQAVVQPNGSFSLNAPPALGNWEIRVKETHWLAQTVTVNTTPASPAPIQFELANGDVDGDNNVTIFDYIDLSSAFDTFEGGPNFNPMADLDEDGSVTIFDYVILSSNFDTFGDE